MTGVLDEISYTFITQGSQLTLFFSALQRILKAVCLRGLGGKKKFGSVRVVTETEGL